MCSVWSSTEKTLKVEGIKVVSDLVYSPPLLSYGRFVVLCIVWSSTEKKSGLSPLGYMLGLIQDHIYYSNFES